MFFHGVILHILGKEAFRKMLWWRQSGLCFYCHEPMEFPEDKNLQPRRRTATFEHLIRKADGGIMSDDNIVLAHSRCNWKRDRDFHKKSG